MKSVRISMPAEVAEVVGTLAIQAAESHDNLDDEENDNLWESVLLAGRRLRRVASNAKEST